MKTFKFKNAILAIAFWTRPIYTLLQKKRSMESCIFLGEECHWQKWVQKSCISFEDTNPWVSAGVHTLAKKVVLAAFSFFGGHPPDKNFTINRLRVTSDCVSISLWKRFKETSPDALSNCVSPEWKESFHPVQSILTCQLGYAWPGQCLSLPVKYSTPTSLKTAGCVFWLRFADPKQMDSTFDPDYLTQNWQLWPKQPANGSAKKQINNNLHNVVSTLLTIMFLGNQM